MSEQMLVPAAQVLNEEQQETYTECLMYVLGKREYRQLLIEGYAGTGKTFTVSQVIKRLLSLNPNGKVALTAPTNKAVRILKDSLTIESDRILAITIHKLLGVKPMIEEDGTQVFQPDLFAERVRVQDFMAIIIDEVSMLDDFLFHNLYKHPNTRVIFMGDPCQIPPVNRIDAIPLQPEKREEFDIHCSRLSQIMRQSDGNPIIELSLFIRENITTDFRIEEHFSTTLLEDGTGIKLLRLSDRDEAQAFIDEVRRLFVSEEFKQDSNYAKVIAWQNDTVDGFNRRIREMIYGKNIPKICIGEKLIADQPIVKKKNGETIILFNNNDEFEVVSYEITTYGNHKVYEAAVEYYSLNGKRVKTIRILHEDDEPKFRNNLRRIKQQAQKLYETDRSKAKQMWHMYYDYMNMFAQVKYNYAITAHKAQGSTYEYCLLHVRDIMKNKGYKAEDKERKRIERNRILYTAVTRPKKLLILGV